MAFPRNTFHIDQHGNGGFIIDSGAPITDLLSQNAGGSDAYMAVMGLFQHFYDGYGHRRVHLGVAISILGAWHLQNKRIVYDLNTYKFTSLAFASQKQI
ncbi:hypothetical protein FEM48_Zijuj01G0225900 [Ziziphus jujuba var. spinosa]|uniref:Peptidase A1 domain-containing protein n=1 Tax=Ziziphus jujuba var. spinosa TaxID=714518 RepID=A0A978W3Y3_ZIZJJ|nr:hypothetical protein FEM48_Zijuj01G0225900 [Ziziphus jujuba var. spinosa]